MSTLSLLQWVALVAGLERAARSYLSASVVGFHTGVWLLVAAFGMMAWRRLRSRPPGSSQGRDRAFAVSVAAALGLCALSLAELGLGGGEEKATEPPRALPPAELAGGGSSLIAFPDDVFGIVVLDEPAAPHADWHVHLQTRLDGLACARTPRVRRTTRFDRALAARPDLIVTRWQCDDLAALLTTPAGTALGPVPSAPVRASSLIGAFESHWRRRAFERRFETARALDPADLDLRGTPCTNRYRALVHAARRRGLDVALLTSQLPAGVDTDLARLRELERGDPELRERLLVARLHDTVVRSIAGSFGAQVIDVSAGRPGEPGSVRGTDAPEWQTTAVADALRPRLARPDPGCAPPR